ncbi:MAG: DUF1028 domain-containing protein [Bacteroidetes bacterium]|nr:DUF1028 domain-containing protein [Bacteroidota bacterium]
MRIKFLQKILAVFFGGILCCQLPAQDTFSIIAVDTTTGEIGSAGASCVDAAQFGGVIILNDIIPGRGGINAQANICIPHVNLVNGMAQMEAGSSPDEILQYLFDNDACQFGNNTVRQYGVVDFDPVTGLPRSAAYTGTGCTVYANHIVGATYAIQGNILLGPEILDSMQARFLAEPGALAKKLMAALQGANVPGADTRCTIQGTSSRSAFLRVSKPTDSPDSFYLELNIPVTSVGVEPIDSLQVLFDVWMANNPSAVQSADKQRVARVFPNPSGKFFTLDWPHADLTQTKVFLTDFSGKIIFEKPVSSGFNQISLPDSARAGFYLLHLKNKAGEVLFSEKIILKPE